MKLCSAVTPVSVKVPLATCVWRPREWQKGTLSHCRQVCGKALTLRMTRLCEVTSLRWVWPQWSGLSGSDLSGLTSVGLTSVGLTLWGCRPIDPPWELCGTLRSIGRCTPGRCVTSWPFWARRTDSEEEAGNGHWADREALLQPTFPQQSSPVASPYRGDSSQDSTLFGGIRKTWALGFNIRANKYSLLTETFNTGPQNAGMESSPLNV